jgi:hypothetical protein
MKKLVVLVLVFIVGVRASAQLVAIFQFPPSGLMYKPQLWAMTLTNTTNNPLLLHVEVTLTPINSSSPVLTGVTRAFTIAPGTTRIDPATLNPIQYNVLSGSYLVDANPVGFLPIGQFEVCYHFFSHVSDAVTLISDQCQDITVGPLGPPELVYPWDQAGIDETHPQFTWLPPVPTNLFTNLSYDLQLVEMGTNQSAADAVEQNVPIFQQSNISPTALLYPISATNLEFEKNYAWRIVAKNNGTAVGTSETWQFYLKHFGSLQNPSINEQAFVELKKDPETAYAVFSNEIKISYSNETSDSVWNVRVYDLSADRSETTLPLDTVVMKKGQNVVRYDAKENSFFVDKHLYQLEVTNSRNETWRLRFEFRKPETANN